MTEPFPGSFPGTIGVPPDIPALVAAADLVCVGRVERVDDEGAAQYLVEGRALDFRRLVATVEVEGTLAGEATGAVEVELVVPEAPSALARLDAGERALLFLVRRGARYALADPATGKQPAQSAAAVEAELGR